MHLIMNRIISCILVFNEILIFTFSSFQRRGGAHLPKNLPLIFYLEVANRVYRTNKPIILMLPKKKYVSGGGG